MDDGHIDKQAAARAQASSSTQAPIAMIKSVSSAIGINAIGGRLPRTGWCQRGTSR